MSKGTKSFGDLLANLEKILTRPLHFLGFLHILKRHQDAKSSPETKG